MTKFKKISKRIALVLLIVIPISALAHFIIFPQQTRSILISYSGFNKDGRLYFNNNTPQNKVDTVKQLIELAANRVAGFWGQKTCNPKYIYCESEEDFKKYGSPYSVPALTHIKLGAYIVISNEGIDLDIIAHEIAHAEFYERLGFYNWSFKIPSWFDEGLAMQNDNRDYYSEDTLKARSNNYKNLPDIKKLKSGKQFNEEGTHEQIMLNFMTARLEVKNWYTKEKLDKLIKDINAGKSFDEAFGK
ncbi:MAG: hypothetical protein IPI88_06960 [Chitinophagaceae bacterium]|nr:hypothetical protein [Chitinophagaceae bacterium]MBL0201949.1 hypothetical protein [Chitinophagaceae bacterium]